MTPGCLDVEVRTPQDLAVLRESVRAWLDGESVAATLRGDILLAVSEAAANGIEHAVPASLVFVHCSVSPGAVGIEVTSQGHWRAGPHSSFRNRGLGIMRVLSTTLDIAEQGGVVTISMVFAPRGEFL